MGCGRAGDSAVPRGCTVETCRYPRPTGSGTGAAMWGGRSGRSCGRLVTLSSPSHFLPVASTAQAYLEVRCKGGVQVRLLDTGESGEEWRVDLQGKWKYPAPTKFEPLLNAIPITEWVREAEGPANPSSVTLGGCCLSGPHSPLL